MEFSPMLQFLFLSAAERSRHPAIARAIHQATHRAIRQGEKIGLLLAGLLACVSIALLACASVALPAQAAEPIRIGSFLSVTGGASFLGDPEKKTLELYVEKINAAGGVLGRPLRLVVYDDGTDAEKAASLAKRLIEQDGVDLVIGGSGTPTSLAAAALMEKAEMPYISLGGGVAITEPVRPWVFKVPHTDRMAAEKIIADIKSRGIRNIALLSENIGFGKSGRDQTLVVAAQAGIAILADEVYGPKDPDVTAQLTRIRNTPGVEALFIFGTGQGPALASRNIRQIGLNLPVYQSHGVASKEFLRLVGDAAEGMRLPAASLTVADQLDPGDPQRPVVLAFKAAYEEAFKTEATTFAGHAWDALHLAVAALNRAGSADKAKFRDALEATSGFVGTGGIFTFTPFDHLGLTLDAFHMVEIRNGGWVRLP